MSEDEPFIPGTFWTPERAREAVERMRATMREPAMAAVMESGPGEDGGPPEEMLAAFAALPAAAAGELDRAHCRYRRARPDDVPRAAALIASAQLPPLFIEEFLGGFVIADCDGEMLGAGALEVYGESGAIRSVVVDERTRGWGLGRGMSELLIEDARAAGVHTVYLFTADALPFWQHLGIRGDRARRLARRAAGVLAVAVRFGSPRPDGRHPHDAPAPHPSRQLIATSCVIAQTRPAVANARFSAPSRG